MQPVSAAQRWSVAAPVLLCTVALLYCATVAGAATSSQTALQSSRDVTGVPATDSRLNTRISIDKTGTSLTALLSELSLQSRPLVLTTSRRVADIKVQLRISNKPLSVVMRCLADFLPGYWEELGDKSGYRLYMNIEAENREARWWSLYNSARAIAIQMERDSLLAMMQEVDKPNDPSLRFGPTIYPGHTFRHLSPNQQQGVAQAISLNADYSAESGGLYPVVEGGYAIRASHLPAAAQSLVHKVLDKYATTPTDPVLEFVTSNGTLNSYVCVRNPGWPTLPIVDRPFLLAPNLYFLAMKPNHESLVQFTRDGQVALPPLLKELAGYQESTVWNNDRSYSQTVFRNPAPRLVEELRQIADSTGCDFVSDYYSEPGTIVPPAVRKQPLMGNLRQNMNRIAVVYDISWKQGAGNICLVRHNRWYRNDRLEVSQYAADTLAALRTKIYAAAAGGKTLQSHKPPPGPTVLQQLQFRAVVARLLSPWQIANGLRWYVDERDAPNYDPDKPTYEWRPFGAEAPMIMRDLGALKFVAQLSAGQIGDLLNDRLAASSLSQSGLALAIAAEPILRVAMQFAPASQVLLGLEASVPGMTAQFGQGDPGASTVPTPFLHIVVEQPDMISSPVR